MSFSSILPKPKNLNSSKWSSIQSSESDDSENEELLKVKRNGSLKGLSKEGLSKPSSSLIPVYGKRREWIPMNQADFGNGIVLGQLFKYLYLLYKAQLLDYVYLFYRRCLS